MADARHGELLNCSLVSQVHLLGLQDIADEVYKDPKLGAIVQTLLCTLDAHPGYSLKNGSLFYKGRMVLVKNSASIPMLLAEFHTSPFGGHSGFTELISVYPLCYFGKV